MVFEYFFSFLLSFRVDRWGSWFNFFFIIFHFHLAGSTSLGFSFLGGSLRLFLSLSQAVFSSFFFSSLFFSRGLSICFCSLI